MVKNVGNKALQLCGGGVNPSNNAIFRFRNLKFDFMFLLRRIKTYCHVMTNKPLCHPEFISGSHKQEILKQVQNDIIFYFKSLGHSFIRFVKRVQGDNVFNIPSYRANEVCCGIFRNLKKALAFTLAETLIVMGIIGVVAALTIPNLNSSTADKEKVAKVMKAYSNISDAIGRAEAVYGPINEWQQLDNDDGARIKRLGERTTEFMKTSKTCGMNKSQGCMGKKIYDKTGNDFQLFSQMAGDSVDLGYKVILADGMSLSISAVYGTGDRLFLFDIDGPNKGPSMLGKDIFSFVIVSNSSPTELRPDPKSTTTSLNNCFQNGLCTEWVVNNGNMDYLKADTSGKCPNGKVLSETVTSCK